MYVFQLEYFMSAYFNYTTIAELPLEIRNNLVNEFHQKSIG